MAHLGEGHRTVGLNFGGKFETRGNRSRASSSRNLTRRERVKKKNKRRQVKR